MNCGIPNARNARSLRWLLLVFSVQYFSLAFGQSANLSKSFGPGACGPADPAYIRTAEETGGIPMFLQRSEAGKAFSLVSESTRSNVQTVFWATGSLGGGPENFDIPVDSVTSRITFTLSVDNAKSTLTLKSPSGISISEGSAAEVTELNCGRIITVASPEAGEWHAAIAGLGRFWLEAEAQSDIHVIKAEFVRLAGRPGHEGMFPIQGQPIAGTTGDLEINVSAKETRTTEFYVVNPHGNRLQRIEMHAINNDREWLEFEGKMQIPDVPFRIVVAGQDINGKQYQRLIGRMFHGETVEVIPKIDFDDLRAGETKRATFSIKNLGPARSFKITIRDAYRLASPPQPEVLQLGSGTSGIVTSELSVPAATTREGEDDLIVLATSTSNPATSNSAVVRLSISSATNKK